jgi:hypothetical protein
MKQQESKPFAMIYSDLLADGWAEHQVTAALDILRQDRRQLSTESVRLWLMQNTMRHRPDQGVIKCPAMAPERPPLPSNPTEGEELRAKARTAVEKALKGWQNHYAQNKPHYDKQERLERRFRRANP